MYAFGRTSLKKLATVDAELTEVPRLVMAWQVFDFAIIWGYRTDQQQMDAFLSGASQKKTGSLHQVTKDGAPWAQAFDFAPWVNGRIPWEDTHAFAVLGGMFIAAGEILETPVDYGGDWDMDGQTTDQTLMDWGHVQKRVPEIST